MYYCQKTAKNGNRVACWLVLFLSSFLDATVPGRFSSNFLVSLPNLVLLPESNLCDLYVSFSLKNSLTFSCSQPRRYFETMDVENIHNFLSSYRTDL